MCELGNVAVGIGFRVFLVNDNDTLHRVSMARYQRLLDDACGERLLEHAGKRVRCALVILDVERRKPQSVIRIDYHIIAFDEEGRIDKTEQEKELRLASEFMSPLSTMFEAEHKGKILDARSQFAKKRYENEFKWSPTPEIEDAIITSIFGKDYF